MLESHVLIALRQLATQKLYSAISVFGLAVGLAAAIMVGLFVRHELSYDGYHPNADRVYRVSRTVAPPGIEPLYNATMPSATAAALQRDFDEIETTARLMQNLYTNVAVGERSYMESGVFAADDEFLEMFELEWLEGDPGTAMRELYSVILTEGAARNTSAPSARSGNARARSPDTGHRHGRDPSARQHAFALRHAHPAAPVRRGGRRG
jgi:putative ABC transport system permease protein